MRFRTSLASLAHRHELKGVRLCLEPYAYPDRSRVRTYGPLTNIYSLNTTAMDMAGPVPELVNTAKPTEAGEPYFQDFDKLGDQILYHGVSSKTSSEPGPKDSPDLVILCSWLYARSKNISKYTAEYQRIYPRSPILLLKQDGPDLFWRPNAWQMDALKPAVSVIKSLQAEQTSDLKVLMHVFSNGGSFTACQLTDAFTVQSQSEGSQLPLSALIFDSAPSIPSASSGYVAMSQGFSPTLPAPVRLFCGAVLYSLARAASIGGALFGKEGVHAGLRRKLNDRNGAFMQKGLSRMYIYSKTDELVPWQHVELHADEARKVIEEMGNNSSAKVQMEEFVGSKHVSHVVVDRDRYWRLVQDFWAESKSV